MTFARPLDQAADGAAMRFGAGVRDAQIEFDRPGAGKLGEGRCPAGPDAGMPIPIQLAARRPNDGQSLSFVTDVGPAPQLQLKGGPVGVFFPLRAGRPLDDLDHGPLGAQDIAPSGVVQDQSSDAGHHADDAGSHTDKGRSVADVGHRRTSFVSGHLITPAIGREAPLGWVRRRSFLSRAVELALLGIIITVGLWFIAATACVAISTALRSAGKAVGL